MLILWVGALQITLDKGKDLDWFQSGRIIALVIVAVIAFTIFLIWELTEEHPVVDLKLFARRNFWTSTLAMALAYGAFFGNVVLLPLWLQQFMGYTATKAGWVLAPVGVLAILLTPLVGKNLQKVDPRVFATGSFAIFALVLFMRAQFNTNADLKTLLIPTMAYVTKHLSFGVTANLSYEPPYALARRFSTLDHRSISQARICAKRVFAQRACWKLEGR